MSATNTKNKPSNLPSPVIRASALTLLVAALIACLLNPSISLAQTQSAESRNSLVYIADSDNQRLNRRLKELLMEAFGDTAMFRSFIAGQTSQDSATPVIAFGPDAFRRVREENRKVPVLGLLVEETHLEAGAEQDDSKVSAVFSTPPLLRQAAIGKTILPYSTRVAMLARPDTEHLYSSVLEDLDQLGMQGRVFIVPSDDRLIPTLVRALNYGDFVLAAPDDTIYNPRTIKHILLTAYRRNRIVIGPSQAYVKAGSLASSYAPLSDMAAMAVEYVQHFWRQGEFPEPAYPSNFGIEINRQVGRSLNIPLPEREALIDAVVERLERAEVSEDE